MSADEVAKAFVPHYYNTFDTNVGQLQGLFQPASMLHFEGQPFQGPENIVGKLQSFGQVKHTIKTQEVQPLNFQTQIPNAILIVVSGTIQLAGNDNPLLFSETFTLIPAGTSYYVHNLHFRLQYG